MLDYMVVGDDLGVGWQQATSRCAVGIKEISVAICVALIDHGDRTRFSRDATLSSAPPPLEVADMFQRSSLTVVAVLAVGGALIAGCSSSSSSSSSAPASAPAATTSAATTAASSPAAAATGVSAA